jgi:hypothetical protein
VIPGDPAPSDSVQIGGQNADSIVQLDEGPGRLGNGGKSRQRAVLLFLRGQGIIPVSLATTTTSKRGGFCSAASSRRLIAEVSILRTRFAWVSIRRRGYWARPEVVWVRRVALVIVLALDGSVGPAAHAVAGRSMASPAAAVRSLRVDFNNDGADDLAVGVPGEDVGSVVDAGAVTVLYGSTGGLTSIGSQQFTQPVSAVETDDQFGAALASGDVDGDGFADLGRVSRIGG